MIDPALFPPTPTRAAAVAERGTLSRAKQRRDCETAATAGETPAPAAAPGPVTGILLGYARVSTDDQRLDLQIAALTEHGVDRGRIYEEHVSGAKTRRPELDACLKALRPGDVLVVWRIDRLGRSLRELTAITEDLERRGIEFRSLHDRFDTTTAVGRLIFHMMAAFAEFERNLISERTRAGLKAARARGRRGGRKRKLTDRQVAMAKTLLAEHQELTHDQVAAQFRVSRATIYRELKRADELAQAKADAKAARAAR